jgi:hypothetical protein
LRFLFRPYRDRAPEAAVKMVGACEAEIPGGGMRETHAQRQFWPIALKASST